MSFVMLVMRLLISYKSIVIIIMSGVIVVDVVNIIMLLTILYKIKVFFVNFAFVLISVDRISTVYTCVSKCSILLIRVGLSSVYTRGDNDISDVSIII